MIKAKEAERRGDYRKLCIINHVQHEVYIEIVEASMLDKKYGGDEEAYIRDLYDFPNDYFENGYVSWEWFVGIYDYTQPTINVLVPDVEQYNEI